MGELDRADTELTIGEVAERAGVSTNAVRYYERYGVVSAHRTSGNARRFTIDAICRIKMAVAAQNVGITLAESAEILSAIPPRSPDIALWAAAGQNLVDRGNARIAELSSLVETYRDMSYIRS